MILEASFEQYLDKELCPEDIKALLRGMFFLGALTAIKNYPENSDLIIAEIALMTDNLRKKSCTT